MTLKEIIITIMCLLGIMLLFGGLLYGAYILHPVAFFIVLGIEILYIAKVLMEEL